MDKKIRSGMMLTLLLIGMSTLAFNIQPAKASGTVYIRADGSIDPTDAPISTTDNITYTLTDSINDSIMIEGDNIVLDGAGCTLKGTGAYGSKGIDLSGRENVTVRNIHIEDFYVGIRLDSSNYNCISQNNITDSGYGILLGWPSSNNIVSRNSITASDGDGIFLSSSSNNTISRNNIAANNRYGIHLKGSSNNVISENNITDNAYGIYLSIALFTPSKDNSISGNNITNNEQYGIRFSSSSNFIYHNNFIDNTQQVEPYYASAFWDDGYPSGGNYWSDYEERYPDAQEIDGSGIWDTPYVIDENNQDNYPLMEPWTPAPPIPTTIDELTTKIEELGSEAEIDNHGIVASLLAKLNVAHKLIEKDKVEEARSILEDDFIPQVQNLTEIHITPEAAELLIESAEHILSNL